MTNLSTLVLRKVVLLVSKTFRDDLVYNIEETKKRDELTILGRLELDEILFREPQTQIDLPKTKTAMRQLLRKGIADTTKKELVDKISFIPTTQTLEVFKLLDQIRESRSLASLRIVGDSRTGKTHTVKAYTMTSNLRERGNCHIGPVLYLEMPAVTSLTPLLQYGCATLGYPVTGSYTGLLPRFQKAVRQRGVEMLIVDEAGNFDSSMKRKQLKELFNRLQIPIVAVSAEAEFFGTDEQLALRFESCFTLSNQTDKDLQQLVKTMEAYLPFEGISYLSEFTLMDGKNPIEGPMWFIKNLTNGRIGKVLDLLKLAAKHALDRNAEFVSSCDIHSAGKTLLLETTLKSGEVSA